ncbi:glutamine synthetase family protein [Ideonella paludis]|uniref:Glutamine synthetase n=1 Tax=Ideonella paludis TaxID=1233411 RepID=A0ABS5DYJ1_9BURK|nr:glutamine synthetase family protein [Ideonella paludis]MBQ0936215.1 glutamine synthetase [Ideonella paludis]
MLLPLAPPSRQDLIHALAHAGSTWVECATSDLGSVARGKQVHADDFVSAAGCRLPSVVWGLTVSAGESAEVFGPLLPKTYDDVHLVPDLTTLAKRPGRAQECTVICEPTGRLRHAGGEFDASALSPRAALRRVIAGYERAGMAALVAPELELFLLSRSAQAPGLEAALPSPHAPVQERACEAYSLERLSHFEPYFDELRTQCQALEIPWSGHAHESALSQFEVNFHPGEPLSQADAVFRFKRLAREVAARHGFLACFAAKPFLDQPGVGTHWHVSLQRRDRRGWPHVFATPEGEDSAALLHFIGGLQCEAAAAMALFAPYDMSFDRIRLSDASPSHASWGHDARSLAFRIPASGASSRRVENRLPGGDANPYLTLAATLSLGLRGLTQAQPPQSGAAESLALPRSLPEALDALTRSQALRELLGDPLWALFLALKRHEHAERSATANPRQEWDLRHLIELA